MNEILKKNQNCIIIVHLNINLIRRKFKILKEVIGNKINIFLISQTKIDATFPLSQIILEEFTLPYRLDRTEHGGGIICFVREEIPSKLFPNVNPCGNIKNIFVKIDLGSKKWLKSGSFNTNVSLIQNYKVNSNKNLDLYSFKYENFCCRWLKS